MGILAFSLVFPATLHYEIHQSVGNRLSPVQAVASTSSFSTTSSISTNPTSQIGLDPSNKIPSERLGTMAVNRWEETGRDKVYLVMDLSVNLLFIKRGKQTVYTALASTGSGKVLHDSRNSSRKWKFDTPKGMFKIVTKLVDPVWVKPDWAFIEKEQPVPKDMKGRLQPGALGKFALGFGDGYFIHGAFYTYLLGFNTTHGCIQLNEEDLRYVFKTVPIGATLIII